MDTNILSNDSGAEEAALWSQKSVIPKNILAERNLCLESSVQKL